MKRILFSLLLIFSMVICLPSCQDNTVEENPEFAKFNEMFEASFENYTITVDTTSQNGQVINDEYVVTTVDGVKAVAYRVEVLNTFAFEGETITAPDNYKTVYEGTCEADKLTPTSGIIPSSSASTSFMNFDVPKFKFSYKHIDNEMIIPGRFMGKITSLNGFMGLNVEASEAEFALEYNASAPKSMQITYVTNNGNTVVITYEFN